LDQNALDLARSLLGSPIIKDYADRINIWKVRLISNQTCGDFPEFGIKRDTALNTTYGGKYRSFLIGIDSGKAAEIIQALLPEYDYIITLSYCPLGIGRGGASSGSEGRVAWNGADYSLVGSGLAHEYGHAIGLLGDEYSEFPGMHLEGEPSVPNVTTVLDEAKIKWKDYLTLATPSPPYAPGVGAFEGAHYYPKGVYRPVYDCMMRSLSPWYCPICSDQMVKRLNELTGTVSYTVTTNPPELQVQVDSTIYTAPHRFSWVPDTTHTLSVSSPQNGTLGTRYVYSSWSDGGAQTHTVTVPSSSTTYTATFSTTQYQLTIASSPPAGGTVTPSPMGDQSGIACPASVGVICPGYYPSGTPVTLTATPNTGYSFSGWSGDLSGTANPTSVTMNGPKTVTANFTATSVTPTAYDFGNVKVKKSKTASFVVKNNGKDNLSITSAITGSDASMFKITSGSGSKKIKPGKTVTIKVAFKPTSKGLKSSELKITSNDPNTPTIDVPLTGTGQ
jgi:uncharacterized repeat protein (TIGR02543 family)